VCDEQSIEFLKKHAILETLVRQRQRFEKAQNSQVQRSRDQTPASIFQAAIVRKTSSPLARQSSGNGSAADQNGLLSSARKNLPHHEDEGIPNAPLCSKITAERRGLGLN